MPTRHEWPMIATPRRGSITSDVPPLHATSGAGPTVDPALDICVDPLFAGTSRDGGQTFRSPAILTVAPFYCYDFATFWI
ncbi:Uncharacterised protein [Mycobacterium tuberculosis]|nr:Uncharacterised protein [Mycobacterium tuberculosis]SIP67473.1 hypothetical protein BN9982_690003 [Mycobacterium tuberculosis]